VIVTEHLPRTHASDAQLAPYFKRTPGAQLAKTAYKRGEYALTDAVIAVSHGSARFIGRRYGLGHKLHTVHNGAQQRSLQPTVERAGQTMRVLGLGSLIWQKGFDVLIDAVRLSESPWIVTLVGAGAQRESLRQAARDLPESRVELLGWVEDPSPYLMASDVVCMPSRWESFPYSALEAGIAAKAVVASRVDGLDEIVVDGVTGILVRPEDPARLARALDSLASQPELVAAMGLAGRERAAEFTVERMVAGTLDVYRSAMTGGRSPFRRRSN
jgi:colanic acid/amylovoran biosynthesis glycosyltransferase